MALAIRASVRGSQKRRSLISLPYLYGSIVGAAGLATTLGLAGRLWASVLPLYSVLSFAAVVAFLSAISPRTDHWPEIHRQVARWWIQPINDLGFFLSASVLSWGVFTFIGYSIFHVMMTLIIALGAMSWWGIFAVAAVYGCANGVPGFLQSGTSERINNESAWLERVEFLALRLFPSVAGLSLVLLALKQFPG